MTDHGFFRAMGALVLMVTGCAVPELPQHAPEHWSRAEAYGSPTSAQAEPSASLPGPVEPAEATPTAERAQQSFASLNNSPRTSFTPRPGPSGSNCLRELGQRKVAHRVLSNLRGVDNPVEIHGTLGGVEYYASDGRSFQLDCRLALALDELGPTMEQFGITRIRYSGAYVYRTTRTGRLSHHAYGLAIDMHEFETKRSTLAVKRDFKRNVRCDARAAELNDLACALRKQPLFEEFLTPDYNADHYDHLHVSVPLSRQKGL